MLNTAHYACSRMGIGANAPNQFAIQRVECVNPAGDISEKPTAFALPAFTNPASVSADRPSGLLAAGGMLEREGGPAGGSGPR